MTDEDQLEFGDLGDDLSGEKSTPTRRRSAKAVDKEAKSASSKAAKKVSRKKTAEGESSTPKRRSAKPRKVAPTDSKIGEQPDTPPERDNATAAESQSASSEIENVDEAIELDVAPTADYLFFLTNRMNLNRVLSSRIIGPREAYDKYYVDLLELAPGWLPLLRVPPPANLIEHVVSEGGAGAPVLIELKEDSVKDAPQDQLVVYASAVAAKQIKAIHFRDEKSLREHQAREYNNVFPHSGLLKVTPDLFLSDANPALRISAPDEHPTVDWQWLDRTRGAIGAAFAASDTGEALAVTAGLMDASGLPTETSVPPWFRWPGQAEGTDAESLEDEARSADRVIFQTSYDALGVCDLTKSWRPGDVLDAMEEEIRNLPLADGVMAVIQKHLSYVRAVVNIEIDFEPFRNAETPFVSARALLLLLLRPNLDDLLSWPVEETGAGEATRVMAAILAGRLRGLSRESISLRNVALDDLTAKWAVLQVAGSSLFFDPVIEFKEGDARTALLFDGLEIKVAPAITPDPLLAYDALEADARLRAQKEISRILGWPLNTRIQLPPDAQVERRDSLILVSSTDGVQVTESVDEAEFSRRLTTLPIRSRSVVQEILQASK